MARTACRLILLLTALAVPETLVSQPAFLVQDIHVGLSTTSLIAELTGLGTDLFFVFNDGVHGVELWKSDGTTAGTAQLIDLCPGICSSGPRSLTVLGGTLFFVADDGERGPELWKSDGTAAGTALVKDIYPGPGNPLPVGFPGGLLVVDGVLYFAADDGEHGQELWRSDGTAGGTVLVRDVHPGPNGSNPRPWAAANEILLFNADDGSHGREPWVSDGTEAGTVMTKDVSFGTASSSSDGLEFIDGPDAVALPGGGFAFRVTIGGDPELWKTDGTEAGTQYIGSDSSDPTSLTVLGSVLYFSAHDDANGRELWKTDGTAAGTALVKDINPGFPSSNPGELTASGGRIFFRASDVDHGAELWASDGTSAGTVLVKDTFAGSTGGLVFVPNVITPFGGGVLFFGFGAQLWRSDGTEAGTVPVPSGNPPNPPLSALFNQTFWALVGSSFFFSTLEEVPPARAGLWRSDGLSASAVLASQSLPPWSFAFPFSDRPLFVEQGQRALFTADQENMSSRLWASDATPAGTERLSSSPAGGLTPAGALTFLLQGFDLATTDGTPAGTQVISSSPSPARGITALGSSVLYPCGAAGFPVKPGLCKSDGTPAGTGLITDIATDVTPFQLTASGSNVFFVAGDSTLGMELWKSDGTEAGTHLVRDVWVGGDSSPDRLIDVAGTLFFSAATNDEGRELWKTDGTETGTVLVKDIRPGQASSIRKPGIGDELTEALGGTLFFVADDGTSGSELWKSDGTAAGTVLVKDIAAGSPSSHPSWLTRVGHQVFFAADDGVHGRELWVTDGTASGTRMVADVFPGSRSSMPQNLGAVGHILLFAATDGVRGLEAWRSNGVATGTRMIQDIAPGALPSSPLGFTSAGAHVFFAANDAATGFEPWAMPRSAALATFGDVPPSYWAYPFVEALASHAITSGCGGGSYCPENTLTRAEMAVFLLVGAHGPGFFPPPATGQVFADVPANAFAASWIEQLAAEGYTAGCGGGNFCPAHSLTRAEMAVFLLLLRHGVGYAPPPATGLVFADVPTSSPFAPWIEQLSREGITGGCGGGSYCPNDLVNRAQMAVFLATALNLPLGQS